MLLSRQIADTDTDKSNESKILNANWDSAWNSTLEDLDLDSLSSSVELELIEPDPNPHWLYSYKYPTDCAFFRRIISHVIMDNRSTHIPKRIAIKDGAQVIFTNQHEAMAEYISNNVPLSSLSATAGMCVAMRLAFLSSPLIVGKGAAGLKKDIWEKYVVLKGEAQEKDKKENFNFVDEDIDSEFVKARMS